ncbi:MAG: ECF-type sigma factor [Bryobacteraceae bacterium]
MAAGEESVALCLQGIADGDAGAMESVYRKAFGRLRSIAEKLLSRERAGHTLQPTALVNECFLKLRRMRRRLESEEHFYHLSARAMRQVLIDHARVRGAWVRIDTGSLPEHLLAIRQPNLHTDLALALKITWERLSRLDAVAAQVIWLRCVEGKTLEETSVCLDRTPSRVREDCEFGLKWMADQLGKRR